MRFSTIESNRILFQCVDVVGRTTAIPSLLQKVRAWGELVEVRAWFRFVQSYKFISNLLGFVTITYKF